MNISRITLAILSIILVLQGCSTIEIVKTTAMGIFSDDDEEEYQGIYKIGNPYRVEGKWYYPKEDPGYSKVGIASWYGAKFHKKLTANGELFDKNEISAAHKTLPLPSIVKVTNLENGKMLRIRVNDRGPFVGNRIIDLSEKAAKVLGVYDKGTARVKVEFDRRETAKMFANGNYTSKVNSGNDVKSTYYTSGGNHFIQTGAFSSRSNANSVKNKLEQISTVFIEDIFVGGRTLYRVKMGPFGDEKKADRILNMVAKLGFNDAIIIRN